MEESSERRLTVFAEVTPRTPAARISRRKGFLSKRTAFVREITREVAGYVDSQLEADDSWMRTCTTCYRSLHPPDTTSTALTIPSLAPYEKRVIELLRNSKDKRARRLAKKRVRLPHHAPP